MARQQRYTMLDHVSDAYIEAYGQDLNEAFDNAARALTNTMIDLRRVKRTISESFKVDGSDLVNLLYNWLEMVLTKITLEGKVFSSFQTKITKKERRYELTATGIGEHLDATRHKPKVEVKAVTYHLMDIQTKDSRVTLRFLLDL